MTLLDQIRNVAAGQRSARYPKRLNVRLSEQDFARLHELAEAEGLSGRAKGGASTLARLFIEAGLRQVMKERAKA